MRFKRLLAMFTAPVLSFILFAFSFNGYTPPDEGMFPLSEISGLDLQKAGLKIPISEVYNPEGASLIDALVRVGGCTGSFVSAQGLILTNHHCAFDFVRQASTVDNNYLEKGFLAQNSKEEIRAEGLTCLITESYDDVSADVLEGTVGVDPAARLSTIRSNIKKIVEEAQQDDENIKAEVSEMIAGQSYILFRYRELRDVRVVYAPPRSIGEFGGERDNWMWPRHTGDFTFIRAYVAPDGSSASYAPENVPYKPKRFIKVNPNGVQEGDFVFVLGYPGTTFRHQTADFLQFHRDVQLPFVSQLFQWLIQKYTEMGVGNPELQLKMASNIKSMANVEKNYRGKLYGIERLNLVDQRREEEVELQKYIDSDTTRKARFGNLLTQIHSVYETITKNGKARFTMWVLTRFVDSYGLSQFLLSYNAEMKKPQEKRNPRYSEAEMPGVLSDIEELYKTFVTDAEILSLAKIVSDAAAAPEMRDYSSFAPITRDGKSPDAFFRDIFSRSRLKDFESFKALLAEASSDEVLLRDPLIAFFVSLENDYESTRAEYEGANTTYNFLFSEYGEIKRDWKKKAYIPDANSTMRLTFGYIKGYSPIDAVYYSPFTTLRGIIEKSMTQDAEYEIPEKLRKLYEAKDFGKFKHPKLNDIPVAMLYNLDTTGGNSGSPVLNAFGEIIGINFDRTFEATINDYTWSAEYSRSIGADIRYVLWITWKIGGADYLLKEMGV